MLVLVFSGEAIREDRFFFLSLFVSAVVSCHVSEVWTWGAILDFRRCFSGCRMGVPVPFCHVGEIG